MAYENIRERVKERSEAYVLSRKLLAAALIALAVCFTAGMYPPVLLGVGLSLEAAGISLAAWGPVLGTIGMYLIPTALVAYVATKGLFAAAANAHERSRFVPRDEE
ncbi:MAG: hypothetical protein RLZZ283_637 [Candidatus Parcubacteria bacterium]|jgi:hypothetical protein